MGRTYDADQHKTIALCQVSSALNRSQTRSSVEHKDAEQVAKLCVGVIRTLQPKFKDINRDSLVDRNYNLVLMKFPLIVGNSFRQSSRRFFHRTARDRRGLSWVGRNIAIRTICKCEAEASGIVKSRALL